MKNHLFNSLFFPGEFRYFLNAGFILVLKPALAFLSLIFLFLIFYFLLQKQRISRPPLVISLAEPKLKNKYFFRQIWSEIHKDLFLGSDQQLKEALVKAGKVFERLLETRGARGDSLKEKFTCADPQTCPQPDRVREAIDFVEKLKTQPDFSFSRKEAEKAIRAFEQCFERLGLYED